jgi:hypothetical protein
VTHLLHVAGIAASAWPKQGTIQKPPILSSLLPQSPACTTIQRFLGALQTLRATNTWCSPLPPSPGLALQSGCTIYLV